MAPTVMEINPLDVDRYYDACNERIDSLMKMEHKDHVPAQTAAVSMYDNVEKPYIYMPGTSRNAMDYQTALSFLTMLLLILIAAPTFSTDYQSGADDIQRCAKYGRTRLGCAKVMASLTISLCVFSLASTVYIVISNSLFGWECTRTSIQMLYSVVILLGCNYGGLEVFTAVGCLLSVLAMTSVSLFISSKAKNNVAALSISLMTGLLPSVIYLVFPGNLGKWLICLLPSSGASLQSGILYAIADFEFLNIGNIAIWTPYAMLIVSAIAIPLFAGLAIRSYSRHGSK